MRIMSSLLGEIGTALRPQWRRIRMMMMPAVHGGEAMYSSGLSTSRVAAIIVAIASAQNGCDGMIAVDRVCT